MISLYQLYQITSGRIFETFLGTSKEKVINNFINRFWEYEVGGYSVLKSEKYFEKLFGLGLEKLGCREYSIEEYIENNMLDLDRMLFTVYSDIKHKGSFNREFVFSQANMRDRKSLEKCVYDNFGEDCLGYLNELLHAGWDISTYEYLNNHNTKVLYVGASYMYYSFHPVPAKTWLEWYNYAKEEIISIDEHGAVFYEENGRFVDYPFRGYDMCSDLIKKGWHLEK